jgi:hypothetical protein
LFALAHLRQFEFSTVRSTVPKPRFKSALSHLPALPSNHAIVEQGCIPVRAKLIDVAACLDRVERHHAAGDFRCVALRKAAALLVDGKPDRARRILEALSDPTTKPDAKSTGKAALGAWVTPGRSAPRRK